MATFWKRAAHSVNRMFSLVLSLFVILVVFHVCIADGTVVLIAPLPGHSLSFTFLIQTVLPVMM